MRLRTMISVLALVLATVGLCTGCGKKEAEPDAISLKEAKETGPVRPSPQMREKMKQRLRQSGTKPPAGN